ncbi:DUF2330 domain-containing protein [Actinocatenispora sera]|uniref:DUF2330 domain-containing protein n=1 Tax=Actinocatenispora sera TaxID=390989 RepID=UPI0033F21669
MTRILRRAAAALAAVVLGPLALIATPAWACACGAVLTHGPAATVADETSLVSYDGHTETITMSLTLTGEPTAAAWFLPVPAKPRFALADVELFNQLANLTAPQAKRVGSDGCDHGACAVPGRPAPQVSVLQRVPVGPYDVATLRASDGSALHDWLAKHGFTLPDSLATGVAPYAKQGWDYVAVRLRPAEGTTSLGRNLPPLSVSFASDELVYPMRLSALASHPQTVRLYVLAGHRMRATGALPTPSDVRYAGWVTPSSVDDPLASMLPRRMFLTRFDLVNLSPARITDDFHFDRAPADTTYRDTTYYADGGPGGTTHPRYDPAQLLLPALGAGAVLFLLLTGVGLAIGRRRTRHPAA